MKRNQLSVYCSLIMFILVICSCVSCSKLPDVAPPGTDIPETGSLEDIGITEKERESIVSNIENTFPKIRSLFLIKNDSLLYEWNRKDVDSDEVVPVHSGAKVITAILTGIAIEDGLFENKEFTTIRDVCPQKYQESDKVNQAILDTDIDSLLRMESGIRFSDMNSSIAVMIRRIKTDSNVMNNIIQLPIDHSRKGKFEYLTESYLAVNAMIMEASGKTDYDYAVEKLFQPLGMSPYAYSADFENMGNVSRDLYLRPVDFAKIGILLLNGGEYDKKQIVNKEWIDKCMKKQARGQGQEYEEQGDLDFGYGLWMDEYHGEKIVFSCGKNGQYLLMLPNRGILITVLSDEKEFDIFYREKLLNWIVTAIDQ